MHDDILKGKINLIIVKDLSRFGRNYIEVGAYVEEFKARGVRLIAADDNYDTLHNEVYLGNLVYGKQRSKSMKSKSKVSVPKEDWIVVENTHEPIISQELWDTVQKIMETRRRPTKTGEVQMFAGLLRCADCGNVLTFSQHK